MTTEPHIKTKNALAGLYGASASSFAFLLLLIFVALTPVAPGDDASIRGAAILAGFIPPIWGVLFLYFFAISFKGVGLLKFALLLQTLWVSIGSILLASVALSHEGWSVAIPLFAITFFVFSLVIGLGSWCSTLAR